MCLGRLRRVGIFLWPQQLPQLCGVQFILDATTAATFLVIDVVNRIRIGIVKPHKHMAARVMMMVVWVWLVVGVVRRWMTGVCFRLNCPEPIEARIPRRKARRTEIEIGAVAAFPAHPWHSPTHTIEKKEQTTTPITNIDARTCPHTKKTCCIPETGAPHASQKQL